MTLAAVNRLRRIVGAAPIPSPDARARLAAYGALLAFETGVPVVGGFEGAYAVVNGERVARVDVDGTLVPLRSD